MAVDDAHVFPSSLIPVLTQLFFPKPPTTFLTCFCRERNSEVFFFIPMFQIVKHGAGPLLTPGASFKHSGLPGDATYRVSKLYVFEFQRRGNLKFFFFVSMFKLVTPGTGPVLTPGTSFEQTW